MKIKGGYYLMARQEGESDIAHAPPHVREIWRYLIREANHQGKKKNGEALERGQVLTTYDDIREDLHWMVGWRKERYTKAQCENAMKFLRKPRRNGPMIATRKTTRGLIITICKYEFYQDPKNYESHDESHNESHNETCDSPQTRRTIDKNGIIHTQHTTYASYVCPELPEADSGPPCPIDPPVLEIPLIKRDGAFAVTQGMIDEWQVEYPGVDVVKELGKIRRWNLAETKRRKTKNGILKHIFTWLDKEQDKAAKGFQKRAPTSQNAKMAEKNEQMEFLRRLREREHEFERKADGIDSGGACADQCAGPGQ